MMPDREKVSSYFIMISFFFEIIFALVVWFRRYK